MPFWVLAQNRPLVDAETFMGRDTSYFVNTLTAQNAYGVKTWMANPIFQNATPIINLKDLNATDLDINATINVNATDVGSGSEDIDFSIYQQVAGALLRTLFFDADVGLWFYPLGETTAPVSITTGGNLNMGATGIDDLQPSFNMWADADSDAGGDTDETLTVTLTPNADPTLATWNWTNTQSAGYVFDDYVSSNPTPTAGDHLTNKTYVDALVTAQDLDFAGDAGTGAVDLDSQTFTLAGTANEVNTSAGSQTITIGLPDDVTIAGALTTVGTLDVQNTMTLGNDVANISGQINFIASDNDLGNVAINTSDQLVFTDFSGGVDVDGDFTASTIASDGLLTIGGAATIVTSGTILNGSDSLVDADAVYNYTNDSVTALRTDVNTNTAAIIELQLSQGVTWNSANDEYTRLGSLVGIATSVSAGDDYLPIQSDMKRCLLADDGTVNYYIDATNPIMKDGTTVTISDTTDATTANKLVDSGADFVTDGIAAGQFAYNSTDDTYSIITAVDDLNTLSLERDIFVSGELYDIGTANFGGADGQVMVETPKFYFNHTLVSTTNSWYISKYDLPGYELHPAFWKDGQQVDYRYMSAFEGGMYDASTGTMCAKASIPSSIYASGDKMTSVAGTWAKTNETRAEYRTMAAQRGTGWRQLDYYLHSAVQLLYLVEYANFNSQTMIGGGRSNLTGGGWTADSYIGLTGLSIPDGNGTNSVMSGTLYDIDGTGYATDYMTYRGIENLFGNVWKMVDGITWDGTWTGSAAAQPVYVTNNSTYFADQVSTNMQHLCDAPYIGAASDYIGNIVNVTGFIPSAGGGTATEEICDYYYQYSEVGRDYWRVVLVGGVANAGGRAGVFSLAAIDAWSHAHVGFGGRLSY